MRLASIDILRALTMVFMIWVNDFWTLIDIPKWLTHASATEDYMGFSDVIFPLFLNLNHYRNLNRSHLFNFQLLEP